MNAILEFNLDDAEDSRAHLRCVMSLNTALCLYELDSYLRTQLKYNEDEMSEDAYAAIEKVKEKLSDIMHENGISLDRLIG